MKKFAFLLILMWFWIGISCLAANVADGFLDKGFDNYLIISKEPIKKISSKDKSVADVKILSTLMNERNMIILEIKKTGKTILNIEFQDMNTDIEVNVKKNKTIIEPKKGFEYLMLDIPPEILEIDEPQVKKEQNG